MTTVSIVGTGYLGTTHAACMADLGFPVIGVDTDPVKVASLAEGRLPFYEPDLETADPQAPRARQAAV